MHVRTITRATAIAAASLAATAVAAPALAAATTPTSLNLRAAHSTVTARHSDTLTAVLSAHGKGVAGQTLVLQERTAPTPGHKQAWTNVTTAADFFTDKGNGVYTFTVKPPLAIKKNAQKDQYRVYFAKTEKYAASHSQVITVTVKRSH
jgi:hypothetical protein